ncbi:MAG: RNA polymerase sigma factor [Bacteroidota bacterium]
MTLDSTIHMPSTGFSITNTVQQFSKKLFGFIRGKVKSTEEAEDILQEVWYQLSHMTDLSSIENMSAWLYRVAQNKVIDTYRKKKNESLEDYITDSDGESEFSFNELLLLDHKASSDSALYKEEFWNTLMEALDELPAKQKEVFILHEIDDLSLQEIANKTGENLKTIISRKGYATKYLRHKLLNLYQELNT